MLAALISVYSQDIKRFLHEWPNTKEKVRKAREQRLIARLALLNRLHNDTYRLLLFVVWKTSRILFDMAVYGMVLFLGSVYTKVQLKPGMYLGYFIGSLVGLFASLRDVSDSLYDYDESVKKIEAKLATLKEPVLK